MLRSLDSDMCDTCAEPAVTVLAIGRVGRGDLLRAVCSAHLERALLGATPRTATVTGDPHEGGPAG